MNVVAALRRTRRSLLLVVLALAVVASASIALLLSNAGAAGPPVQMTVACVDHRDPGSVRYVSNASQCGNNETVLTFDPAAPVILCIKDVGDVVHHPSSPTGCGGTGDPVEAPSLDGRLFFCAQSSSGTLRFATGPDDCGNNQFSVFIEARNQPPTDIQLSNATIAENSANGTVVGTLSASDPDPGDTFTFTLLDSAGGAFAIVGTELRVANGTLLDYETAPNHQLQVVVRATDSFGGTFDETLTITLTDANDLPTDIALDDASVDENQPVGALAGTFSTTDQDAGDTHTYALVSGAGSDDNGSFTISGDQLLTNAVFDVETKDSYTIRVQTDDGHGGTFQKQFTITVTDVNDAPVAVDDAYDGAVGNTKAALGVSVSGEPVVVLTGSVLLANDSDQDDPTNTLTATLATPNPPGGRVVMLNADGTYTYVPAPGFTGVDSFDYTVADPDGATATGTVSITVGPDVVWYVNNAAAAGDGRSSSPFNTLAPLNGSDPALDPDAAGHIIFVYQGTGAYTGGLALEDGQQLLGQPHGLTVAGNVLVPAGGSNPTVDNAGGTALALAGGNTLRAVNASGLAGIVGANVGTLTISGASVNAALGVDLANGTLDVTFTSVTSSGGANGIKLVNTAGGFSVTGDGATAGSGGTLQGSVGDDGTTAGVGVYLENAAGVSLAFVHIADHPNFAILGSGVAGFSLANSVVDGSNGTNAALGEASIAFSGLTGTASLSNTTVSGGAGDNLRVRNSGGVLDRLTLDTVTVGLNSATDGNDGVTLEASGDAVANVTVQDSTFTGARADIFQLTLADTAASDLVFSGNALSNSHAGVLNGAGGMVVAAIGLTSSADQTLTYSISGNTFRDSNGSALVVSKPGGAGDLSGTIADNTIGVAAEANSGSKAGSGIVVLAAGQGSHTVTIEDNEIFQYNGQGILVQAGGVSQAVSGFAAHDAHLEVTATGNTIASPGTLNTGPINGVHLNAGTNSNAPTGTPDAYGCCLTLTGNTLTGSSANGGSDVLLRQRFATTVGLPGYAGGNTDTAAITAFVQANNTGAATVTVTTSAAGGGFVGACP